MSNKYRHYCILVPGTVLPRPDRIVNVYSELPTAPEQIEFLGALYTFAKRRNVAGYGIYKEDKR